MNVLNCANCGGNHFGSCLACAVHEAATKVVQSTEHSLALFGEKAVALSRLAVLAQECAEPGWNGAAAAPLDPIAISRAGRFIRSLPDGVPLPEFAPEPDGAVSLDWIASPTRLFSLSIGRSNRVAYAWLDGADKGHGVARFDGQNVPLWGWFDDADQGEPDGNQGKIYRRRNERNRCGSGIT